jgi:hypothetical protein
LQALARLMADRAGRRWVRQFLAECHVWDTGAESNAIDMAFRAGQRFQGLKVQRDIAAANLEAFLLLQKEYFLDERATDGDRDGRDGSGDGGDGGDGDPFA